MSPEMSSTTAGPLHVSRFGKTLHWVLPEPGGAIVTSEPSPEYVRGESSENEPMWSDSPPLLAKGVLGRCTGLSQAPPPDFRCSSASTRMARYFGSSVGLALRLPICSRIALMV